MASHHLNQTTSYMTRHHIYRQLINQTSDWIKYRNRSLQLLRLVLCEELLRLDKQSRAMVNAGQRSCACDWLCWYVATGTRRGKRCALFCLATGYPAAGSMRRRLDKLVRRRFEDQSMVCLVIDFSVRSTGWPAFVF
ncbi:hypothetical protein F511_27599 [Dorcoceras hygrometricum]|uniref:Uncharacterized protein n=1 Tax=Dorcoceras hygrometricum TaxID=472368 RepID=A0A2Z7C002_9LAMI|nr:hypothetical protein F511_27599 [Dorcoceras hygrometricum]